MLDHVRKNDEGKKEKTPKGASWKCQTYVVTRESSLETMVVVGIVVTVTRGVVITEDTGVLITVTVVDLAMKDVQNAVAL